MVPDHPPLKKIRCNSFRDGNLLRLLEAIAMYARSAPPEGTTWTIIARPINSHENEPELSLDKRSGCPNHSDG